MPVTVAFHRQEIAGHPYLKNQIQIFVSNINFKAEWTPFQTHYFSENLVAPRIEPGTSGSVVRNSDH
jgi:hypothetical protein